ncbi:hypothetical protein RF11_03387 [Thelohanellus kitauei]|uniref:Uncharacterized protein n=1 Tax=Thelohanellus kitauei TaxID=669202 RepID=A0A0C2MSV7_THEKT|nr:hypothetical protein RF11_03387 [Thelohanellus kitauei]
MEDIKKEIDQIIINGLMMTSNDYDWNAIRIYDRNRLLKLVIDPLRKYAFENCGPCIKDYFEPDLQTSTPKKKISYRVKDPGALIDHNLSKMCSSSYGVLPFSEKMH